MHGLPKNNNTMSTHKWRGFTSHKDKKLHCFKMWGIYICNTYIDTCMRTHSCNSGHHRVYIIFHTKPQCSRSLFIGDLRDSFKIVHLLVRQEPIVDPPQAGGVGVVPKTDKIKSTILLSTFLLCLWFCLLLPLVAQGSYTHSFGTRLKVLWSEDKKCGQVTHGSA